MIMTEKSTIKGSFVNLSPVWEYIVKDTNYKIIYLSLQEPGLIQFSLFLLFS